MSMLILRLPGFKDGKNLSLHKGSNVKNVMQVWGVVCLLHKDTLCYTDN